MKLKKHAFSLVILILAFCTFSKSNATDTFYYSGFDRKDYKSYASAIGFTLDPDAFLIAQNLNYFLINEISLGGALQFAISDDDILLTAGGDLEFIVDIDSEDFLRRVKPNFLLGTGFAMAHLRPIAGISSTDFGVFFNLGFGFDIFLNDKIALGNQMLFNILTITNERFFFSCKFIRFRYLFN